MFQFCRVAWAQIPCGPASVKYTCFCLFVCFLYIFNKNILSNFLLLFKKKIARFVLFIIFIIFSFFLIFYQKKCPDLCFLNNVYFSKKIRILFFFFFFFSFLENYQRKLPYQKMTKFVVLRRVKPGQSEKKKKLV